MAVTQISRIQHRRGLQQDLPQLASAELGWSVDQRKLFIGNGTLEEGAPTTGVTEILTQYSDLTQIVGAYTFKGNAAGYEAQTGSSALAPIVRSYQQKFDDFVNVRDFGAQGDSVTDDTAAINRALQQIYKSGYELQPLVRRTIYFPGGVYLVSNTIQIPPFARLVGDGQISSIIYQTQGNRPVANIADSKFISGPTITTSGGLAPQSIEISGLSFYNGNTSISSSIFNVDSTTRLKFLHTSFYSNNTAGTYPTLVSIYGSASATSAVTFDTCRFYGGGSAINNIGSNTKSIRVINSDFTSQANAVFNLGTVDGFVSIGNFYNGSSNIFLKTSATNYYSLADNFSSINDQAIKLGNLSISQSRQFAVSSTTVGIVSLLANSSGSISYEISNSSMRRFGTFVFTATGTETLFNDTYNETTSSLDANLFANASHLSCSVTTGPASINYSLTSFNL